MKRRDQPRATAQTGGKSDSAMVCFRVTVPHPAQGTDCQMQNLGSGLAAPQIRVKHQEKNGQQPRGQGHRVT